MAIKPIPFNTEMVRAILEGRKTQTRRVVKQPPIFGDVLHDTNGWYYEDGTRNGHTLTSPYNPGDILYVPEAWKCASTFGGLDYEVEFRDGQHVKFQFEDRDRAKNWAKYRDKPSHQWQSPYFMPREAARIFLRVKDVRVQRLQDIKNAEAIAEGCDGRCEGPQDGALSDWQKTYDFSVEKFASVWDSTIKKADLPRYGWEANPWVWVITFEHCEKPEGWLDP